MGGVVKGISSALGIGSSAVPEVEKFQMSDQAKALQASADPAQFRQGQADLVSSLQAQLAGEGPSLAKEQLKAGTDRNLQQQLAAAASTRSASPSTARNLLRSQAETGQQAAQQGAQLAAQEQLAAQSQLGNALQGARGQDIQSIVQPEQISAQTFGEQLRAQTALQQQAQQQQQALTGALLGGAGAVLGGPITDMVGKFFKGGKSASGAVVPPVNGGKFGPTLQPGSDKRIKEDIKKVDDNTMKEFLDTLSANSFKYKEGDGSQKFGIMAQDLEKSKIGKTLVNEENGIKTLDTIQGFGTVLASQAALNKRLAEIEAKLGKGKKSSKDDNSKKDS